jgi:hypothetical protein
VDVAASDSSPAPGDTVSITATARDADGNPVAGAECTFEIASQPGGDARVDEGPLTTDENGLATAALHVGGTVGTVEVRATCNGLTQVLAVEVGVGLPETGGGRAPGDRAYWLLLAAGLVALGIGAFTLGLRRA